MRKNKLIKYTLAGGVWLAILLFLSWILSSRLSMLSHQNSNFEYWHFFMALTALIFKTIFASIIIFYVFPHFSKKRKLPAFIGQSIMLLGVLFAIEQSIQAYITKSSWAGMHLHGHGFLSNNPFWVINLLLYLLLLLIICLYYFTREWVKSEKQKRALIETQLSTELKFLKSQVNPHFLFNTLNNLYSIAQRNKDIETANGISKLAGLMRYMLYDSAVIKVSLEKEVNNINNYILLAKLRYTNDEVIVNLSTTGDLEKTFIAPMILLPFIENAFKHGVDIDSVSTISIVIEAKNDKIIFQCTNPIAKSSTLEYNEYGGIGLENVKRRLALLYPDKHKLEITDTGADFTVYLKMEA